jgi:hypothetical protein
MIFFTPLVSGRASCDLDMAMTFKTTTKQPGRLPADTGRTGFPLTERGEGNAQLRGERLSRHTSGNARVEQIAIQE